MGKMKEDREKRLISRDAARVAEILREDRGIVAVPTETVFGLAVGLDGYNSLSQLIRLKERQAGSGKVFTLVPNRVEEIGRYGVVNEVAERLIEEYVPGELTVILPKNPGFSHRYFDHFQTVGVRIPRDEFILTLLEEYGEPILLTSANRRGKTALKTAAEVLGEFTAAEVPFVVGGVAGGARPSTVVDCTGEGVRVLRGGGVKILDGKDFC